MSKNPRGFTSPCPRGFKVSTSPSDGRFDQEAELSPSKPSQGVWNDSITTVMPRPCRARAREALLPEPKIAFQRTSSFLDSVEWDGESA
jgi:hypothetical protein